MPPGGLDATLPASRAPHTPAPSRAAGESRPERIGDCRIEKRLGTGGFGDVWLAVQETDLLKRRVAIKLLKRGMDSDAVLERFQLERRVLDTLNHPNIARLLGGGVTQDGRSYFIMEFVEGLTLDAWCDRQALDVRARVGLLRQVASALAHAHDKGIVHRDIKPANVLVGADGVPKLLDFGIAKILNPELAGSERSHQTLPGEVGPLTPVYASPEQLLGHPLGPSTDIYSMGAMMYEILSGVAPFDFSRNSLDEIRRRVCEEMPQAPSRAAGQRTTLPGAGGGGTADPSRLRRGLRGELDDIVLMAMRKETQRRYADMKALMADLDAWLEGLPVSARPASTAYVAQKWIQRRRLPLAIALVALLGAAGTAGVWAWKRHQAEVQDREELARIGQAVRALPTSSADLSSNPDAPRLLQEAEQLLERRLAGHPEDTRASDQLLEVLYRRSVLLKRRRNYAEGLPATAMYVDRARAALERWKRDEDRKALAQALLARGDLLFNLPDYPRARQAFDELLAIREAMAKAKPEDVELMSLSTRPMQRIYECLVAEGRLEEALSQAVRLRKLRDEVVLRLRGSATPDALDPRMREAMIARSYEAGILLSLSRLDEAETVARDYLDQARGRAKASDEDWNRLSDLCVGQELLYLIALNRDDTEACGRIVAEWQTSASTAGVISKFESVALRWIVSSGIEAAAVRNATGRHDEALQVVRETIRNAELARKGAAGKKQGEAVTPEMRLLALTQEMRALRGSGHVEEARAVAARAVAAAAEPGAGPSWMSAVATVLSEVSRTVPDPADAERHARKAVQASVGTGDSLVEATARESLVLALRGAGKQAEAATERKALEELVQAHGTPRMRHMLDRLDAPPSAPAVAPAAAPAPSAPAAAKPPA